MTKRSDGKEIPMRQPRRNIWLFCAALSVSAAMPVSAELTGAQVMERCRKAYAGLKSYQGEVLIKLSVVGPDGKQEPSVTRNTVQFVRPARFRVDGKSYDESPVAYR